MARSFTRVITTPAAARSPREWNRPFVSLLSDWGERDPSPAICRAVVLGIAPEALVVDISHEVDKYNVRHGALLLWCALPFLPIGPHDHHAPIRGVHARSRDGVEPPDSAA